MKIIGNTCDCFKQTKINCVLSWDVSNWLSSHIVCQLKWEVSFRLLFKFRARRNSIGFDLTRDEDRIGD